MFGVVSCLDAAPAIVCICVEAALGRAVGPCLLSATASLTSLEYCGVTRNYCWTL